MRDLDDEAQVGANHQGARFAVALLDLRRQLNFLLRGEERDLPDLAQINFDSGIAIFGGHKTFHDVLWGACLTSGQRSVPRT